MLGQCPLRIQNRQVVFLPHLRMLVVLQKRDGFESFSQVLNLILQAALLRNDIGMVLVLYHGAFVSIATCTILTHIGHASLRTISALTTVKTATYRILDRT